MLGGPRGPDDYSEERLGAVGLSAVNQRGESTAKKYIAILDLMH